MKNLVRFVGLLLLDLGFLLFTFIYSFSIDAFLVSVYCGRAFPSGLNPLLPFMPFLFNVVLIMILLVGWTLLSLKITKFSGKKAVIINILIILPFIFVIQTVSKVDVLCASPHGPVTKVVEF